MTASLLRCLCQQFEMAPILRACVRSKLSGTDTSKWKIYWMRPVRLLQLVHHKCCRCSNLSAGNCFKRTSVVSLVYRELVYTSMWCVFGWYLYQILANSCSVVVVKSFGNRSWSVSYQHFDWCCICDSTIILCYCFTKLCCPHWWFQANCN